LDNLFPDIEGLGLNPGWINSCEKEKKEDGRNIFLRSTGGVAVEVTFSFS
jgi:hypothetical protein